MRRCSMAVTEIRNPEVDIDKVHVVDGFNSRRHFDPDELARMAETMKVDGIVEPLKLKQREDGEFDLVAGERRLRAARIAGLNKVPYTVSTGNARAEALIENMHRADLNPIETALDLKALGEEFGLTTDKAIADRAKIGKTPTAGARWVGAHRRLLDLPEAVQAYIASGDVPVAAEPKLRKIAAVSPEIAALVCVVAKRDGVTGLRFVERFGDLLALAAAADIKGKPTMINARQCWLGDIVTDEAKHEELAARISAVSSYGPQQDPTVPFSEVEADAARAHGCLVEYRPEPHGRYQAYLTDLEFAQDLVERAVERREREVEERRDAEAKAKADQKDQRKKEHDARKESGEETPQAKARKRQGIARRANEHLKRMLLKKRTPARRKKYALARSKAIVVQMIADNPNLAGAGLRLVSDRLQQVEVKPLKKGGTREKITYADAKESTADLLRRVDKATEPLEVIEIGAEALLAALLADDDETPNKDRIYWSTSVDAQLTKLLATEIKEVRPRRVRKPY